MNQTEKKQVNWRRIGRVVTKTLLVLVALVVVLFIFVQTPPAQNLIRKKVVAYLEKKLQTTVTVGHMNIGLDRMSLGDLYMEDRQKDTLMAGGKAFIEMNLVKLLFKNKLDIKSIILEDFNLKVKRGGSDKVFNFQFVLDAFTPRTANTTVDTGVVTYAIPKVIFRNIRFNYKDAVAGLDTYGVLEELDTRIDALDAKNLHFDIPSTSLTGLNMRVYQYKPIVGDGIDVPKTDSVASYPLLDIGRTRLRKIVVDFDNDISSLYTRISIGELDLLSNNIDLANRVINLDELTINDTKSQIRLGRSAEAKQVEQEVEEEVEEVAQKGWQFIVGKLQLRNNDLRFDNDNKPKQAKWMDYAHIDATNFNLVVDDFRFRLDSISGQVREGSFREQSGFVLEALRGNVLYSNTTIFLDDLYLKTPGTELKRYARMDYASLRELGNDFPSTKMDFNISNSHVKVSDILTFAPTLAKQPAFSDPDETWTLNLQGSGTMKSFHIEELQFAGLGNTRIDASGSMAIGENVDQTGGTLFIRELYTTQSDIALFTGSRLSQGNINLPEAFNVTGTLRGGIGGLNADLQIGSTAGSLGVVGVINNLNTPATATYSANIRTSRLNLGSIIRNSPLGRITANLTVKGKGLKAGNFDTDFKGTVYSVDYNNYSYRNIKMNGSLNRSTLNLRTDIDDPNIDLEGRLVAQLTTNPSFIFNGFVDSMKLHALHLTTEPVVFRGKINANVPFASADRLDADILVTDALLVSSSQRLPLDTVRFKAGQYESGQFITVSSDIANADLRGQFRIADLASMFQQSIQPYFAIAPGGGSNLRPYNVEFTADIANAPVVADLVAGLESFEPIHISGTLTSEAGINARAQSSSIHYMGNQVQGLDLIVTTTPQGLLFNGDMQRLKSRTFDIYHTRLHATALNNKLDFTVAMDDAAARQRYFVGGIVNQTGGGNYILSLKPDSLMLNYERWNISPSNSLIIGKDHLQANNFTLSKGPEILSLQSSGDELNVTFTSFEISTITAFLKSDSMLANGQMTGNIAFKNLFRQPVFTSDLSIANLSIQGDTLGNASIKVDNTSGNRYNTNAVITGRGNDISLTGSFTPSGEKDILLDLNLGIRQLQLSSIDGAMAGFIKNASGSLNGDIKIGGSLAKPSINGPVKFNNASFALTMLGSQYRIDGEEVVVTENGFQFDNFIIRDTSNQVMRLDGNVQTTDFVEYTFNVDMKADNFKLLNTTKKDNKIYYGDFVVTSDLHIGGTSVKPAVDGSITVNEGTNLTVIIPQREPGVVAREGIVEFVNMDNPAADTLFREYDSLNLTPFVGMDIAANIEIRKEAIFNIVVDEANGDFLNLQGEALLTAGIDPSGKITLVGNYELERGAYEITFNFLKRRFDIQKGSRIEWYNEMTRANLNVTAVYIANTSPIDLVQNQIEAATATIRNTYLQKLPFEVTLKLTGDLLQPKVSFDIILPEDKSYGVSNDIITQVQSRLEQVRTDPGEINKQVFALLLLNRFVGENPLESNTDMFSGSAYVRQSVSKLLTEQLNQFAAGLIDGVDLRFDITTAEDYTTGSRRSRTDLNIGLSKQLLNERLTVSVGTNYELEGPRNTKQGASNALGNLSVDYAISRDKRYMIRFYRKNEYQGVVDGYVIESGLSFLISVDYEKFRELITRRKKQKLEGVE